MRKLRHGSRLLAQSLAFLQPCEHRALCAMAVLDPTVSVWAAEPAARMQFPGSPVPDSAPPPPGVCSVHRTEPPRQGINRQRTMREPHHSPPATPEAGLAQPLWGGRRHRPPVSRPLSTQFPEPRLESFQEAPGGHDQKGGLSLS